MRGALKNPGFYLGAGVTLVFIPNLAGSAVLTGWPFLAAFFAVFLPWRKVATNASLPTWLGLGFLLWAGLSLLWTENIYDGIGQLAIWIILGLSFVYGATHLSEDVYFGFAVGVSVCVGVALAQAFGIDPINANEDFRSNVSGLYINSTIFGTTCALALAAALFSGFWWFVPIGLIGLYLSGGRGPAIAFLLVAFLGVWKWSRGLALILAVPAALFAGGVFIQKNDLSYTTTSRLAYWIDTAETLSWQGHGVGSFFQLYPTFAKRTNVIERRPEHPYSDPLEIIFEFGVGSLLLWAMLILLLEVPSVDRYVLLTFLLIGLSYFPLAFPPCAFLAAFAAGRLASSWALVRRGQRLRGLPIPSWLDGPGYVSARALSGTIPLQPNDPN